jgi:hypothetical protein
VSSEFPADVEGACALPPQQCDQDSDDKERVSGIVLGLNTQSKYGSGSRNSKKYENEGFRNCVTQIKKE